MEKKGPQMDNHSSGVEDIPELDSYDIIESPLLESLKNVFSLLEPAKQEIEEARKASLSIRSQQQSHNESEIVKELQEALAGAKQEIHALKNQRHSCCAYNTPGNADKGFKETIKSFESKVSDLEKENGILKGRLAELNVAYQDVTRLQEDKLTEINLQNKTKVEKILNEKEDTISRLSTEVAALKRELSDNKTRLSKLMGDKLSNKNPDIADLSDMNRPTKIAEKFNELYDNQWTDAYEAAERLFKDQKEEYRIKVLLQLLMNVNKFCLEEFSGQESDIEKVLLGTSKPQTEIPAALLKDLKDYRKFTAEECIPKLVEKYLQNETKTPVKKLANEAKEFTYGCVSVCWLMAHQDPQVALHSNVQRSEIVDGNFYKAYTQSGKKVDFIVWPALLLHKDGPVLAKGVAQYMKPDEKKTESTNNLLKKPVTNTTKTENEKTTKIHSQQGNKSPLTANLMSQSVRQKTSSSLNNKTNDFSKTVVGSTVTGFDNKDILAEFDKLGQIEDTMETGGRETVSEQIQQQNQQQNQQQQQHQQQHRQQPLSTYQQNLSGAQQQQHQQQQQYHQQQPQQQTFQHVDARNNSASATFNRQQNQNYPQQIAEAQAGCQLMTGGFQQNITNLAASLGDGAQTQTMSYYQQQSIIPSQDEISWYYHYININNNNYERARFQMNSEFYSGCYEKCYNYLLWWSYMQHK